MLPRYSPRGRSRRLNSHHKPVRLLVERLEDRTVPSSTPVHTIRQVLQGSQATSQPNAAALVDAFYLDLLHRQPSAQEVAGWVSVFASGATRLTVVSQFVNSPEFRSHEIIADYQNFLGR